MTGTGLTRPRWAALIPGGKGEPMESRCWWGRIRAPSGQRTPRHGFDDMAGWLLREVSTFLLTCSIKLKCPPLALITSCSLRSWHLARFQKRDLKKCLGSAWGNVLIKRTRCGSWLHHLFLFLDAVLWEQDAWWSNSHLLTMRGKKRSLKDFSQQHWCHEWAVVLAFKNVWNARLKSHSYLRHFTSSILLLRQEQWQKLESITQLREG